MNVNRSGMGVGSASVVLMFAVLCLTIFTLISLTAANNYKSIADISAKTVKEYYEADTLAECIVAEILEAETLPESVKGIDIATSRSADVVYAGFSCPMSETKVLLVEIEISEDSYDILTWRVQDAGIWNPDEKIKVWNPDEVSTVNGD